LDILEFDFALALQDLVLMGVAYLLAFPLGWEREHAATGGGAGLRTFPLVAVASCSFVLIGITALGSDANANSRVLYGVMTGLGFIGAGAILKGEQGVHGTATAASLWATGALGAAVGFRRYEIAVLLALLTFVTLRFTRAFKRRSSAARDRPGAH
jgi:putative Mg2+ transporter-C (MgtC) family protein